MQNVVWRDAIARCADPGRAEGWLDQLRATNAGRHLKEADSEQARILAALLSGSQALSELLLAHPDWVILLQDSLQGARQKQGLDREVQSWLRPMLKQRDYAGAYARLRVFKQRELLRIAARDLARLAELPELVEELSNVADVCLQTVCELCFTQFVERFGSPYHQDSNERWVPTPFVVLGLGKLGGRELNYSSDVDVIFVYSEEGHAFKDTPRKGQQTGKGLSNHQFFIRLAEAFIAEVGRLTPDGMLYRIDLRLRPEGNAGPLARSVGSYENYYTQWGQTWERMMLIKARRVAGSESLAGEFLEMIQPFRYPRSLGERTLDEIAAMKTRIELEVVKSGEMDRNVKLGRGGIREIEFIVQTLQLLNAGRIPFLQGAQTLPALEKLVQYDLLPGADAETLSDAYRFLRDVEHRLQMENNLQTHTIPTERKARERLAALMGFDSLREFEEQRQAHTQRVRAIYERLLTPPPGQTPQELLPPEFEGAEPAWKTLLARHSFRDPDNSLHMVETFVQGPGYVHVSPRSVELARQLLRRFFNLCRNREIEPDFSNPELKVLSDPDRVLARLDSFIAAYGTRAMLYETWTTNPSLFELLLLLFDRSEFLAETAIRTPDLVDELELSGRLRRQKSAPETLADLRHGLADKDQLLWLRRYHQAELMRIGLRDILGLADFEQNHEELSALADACIQYAVEVVTRRNRFKSAPFAVIGLGKLGGTELNYGSDLDILFVAENDARNLPQLQRLAREVMELIASPTELGVAFEMDARLRPDGEKGLLVNTLAAHEDYYRTRAQLWEIQSISRTRPVAGDQATGEQFQQLAAVLTNFQNPSLPLHAFQPDWKRQIHQMRMRIEKERTPSGKHELAIKTGTGGLMDAEFIAQALSIEHGWKEANTLRALQRAAQTGAVPDSVARPLIENYRRLRRIEGILRRWSFAGETLLPDDPAPLYRVAIRCGFPDAQSLLDSVNGYRTAIRSAYEKVFAV